jgi:hypothetical protein
MNTKETKKRKKPKKTSEASDYPGDEDSCPHLGSDTA